MLSDDELVSVVRREIEQAQGYDSDVLSTKRENALNYYHGIMPGTPDGCSEVVSKDVADTVHALLAQVGPIFQTSLINFKPLSEKDEQAAQLESDYVRHTFEASNGQEILYDAAFDALLIANGWIKVTVDEKTAITHDQYGDLDEWQLIEALKPTADHQKTSAKSTVDSVTIQRETTTRKLVVECIGPEVMLFSSSAGQFKLEELRMVGERVLYTTSDLIKMGLTEEEAMSVPESGDDYWPAYRAQEGIYQNETGEEQATQTAERLRECFDVHFRVDLEENNQTELRHIVIGGQRLITNEPAKIIPYATGSPIPMPHRIQGTGLYEVMAEVQDQKTDILRRYLDNLSVMNGSRVEAVEGEVNMEDLTSGRLNSVVRVTAPGMVTPMPSSDIGQQAITGLTYMDSVRSQRGGASVDQNDADRQLMGSSATAANGVMQSAERTSGWYAHNLVNTLLKDTYMLIHERLRHDMPGQVQANLRGKWITTDPGQWRERLHTEVMAGLTTTERNNKIMGLSTVITQLNALMQQGGEGIITDKGKLYGAMSDWIQASELGQPEEYLIDPDSKEAQQAQQKKQQQSQAQQQAMQQQQNQVIELQRQIEQQKVEYDYYKTNAELKFKYYDAQLDAEVKETDMTLELVKSRENETVQQSADS